MNQSDLAEQGAIPLATLNPLEATPDVPTMAARNTTEHSEHRPGKSRSLSEILFDD